MPEHVVLSPAALQAMIEVLRERGYRVLGPTRKQGAITLGELTNAADLPHGCGDEQEAGHYRLRERDDDLVFGFAAPAQSTKSVLFPPDELLWRGRRDGPGYHVEHALGTPESPDPQPVAVLGLRGCDLAAIGIQDRVLLGRLTPDAHYAVRRADAFLVAVTCGSPAATCFCTSMGTGPAPGPGADLTLTELSDPHRFLATAATSTGQQVLADLPSLPATAADSDAADAVVAAAVAAITRAMPAVDLPSLLYDSTGSSRWADIGNRCLACTNCTSVCPTCFCTDVEDVSDLSGDSDERHRVWASCFSQEYSYVHGGAVRGSTAARYRQWLTHKLAAWHDQFGTSGCVGCGRCITWCPAGIDLTVEVAALAELARARGTVAAGVAAAAGEARGAAMARPSPDRQEAP